MVVDKLVPMIEDILKEATLDKKKIKKSLSNEHKRRNETYLLKFKPNFIFIKNIKVIFL